MTKMTMTLLKMTDDNGRADPHAAAGVQDGQHGEDLVLHHWVGQLWMWGFANLETVPKQPVVLSGLWV